MVATLEKGTPRRRLHFTPQSRPLTRFMHLLNAYFVSWTIGWLVIVVVLGLMIAGKLRTRGYWRGLKLLLRGKVIIAANHPSLIEPFVISVLYAPFFLLVPLRVWPWGLPDRNTFLPRWLWGVYWMGRCITVDRKKRSHNNGTLRRSEFVLSRKGNITVHVEATRTPKAKEHIRKFGRIIGRIRNRTVFELAASTGAWIQPVYADFPCSPPDGTESRTWQTVGELFTRGMTINFGKPFKVSETYDLDAETSKLEDAILSAGLE